MHLCTSFPGPYSHLDLKGCYTETGTTVLIMFELFQEEKKDNPGFMKKLCLLSVNWIFIENYRYWDPVAG